jgi:transposase
MVQAIEWRVNENPLLNALLTQLPGFQHDQTQTETGQIRISLRSTQTNSACPLCSTPSTSVHSTYQRSLASLPTSGTLVTLELRVRRFHCHSPDCTRAVFCERFNQGIRAYARRTHTQTEALRSIGLALGGNAGARLGQKLGVKASASTVLRIVHRTPEPKSITARIIGVDDFAFKRGHTYGTVIVNLETRKPIDLLPDRQADTLAAWLKAHPGIKVVTRDRSKEYALGISEGAPKAWQVVDRWHLLKNLRECLERVLDGKRTLIAQIGQTIKASIKRPRSSSERKARDAARERRKTKHGTIRAAIKEGGSVIGIAKELGVSRWLVRQCLKPDEAPPRQFHKRLKSVLDPFESYLVKRWAEGCTTASVLCLEIKARGYTGSCKMVEGWAYRQREAKKASGSDYPAMFPGQGFGSRDLAWLLMREEAELSEDARAVRDRFLRAWPELERVQGLALELIRMVRNRQKLGFDDWLLRVKSCSVHALVGFAMGLEREVDAVKAALSLEWSNGPTEGNVNRIKLVKRMMYGRASLPLLRKMVVLDG